MEMEVLEQTMAVCKLSSLKETDLENDLFFLCKTDKELSLVCPMEEVPDDALKADTGWRCMRIAGELDFSLIGILADISAILAAEEIGIFAVSTYDTDYILLKEERLEEAIDALTEGGYEFI